MAPRKRKIKVVAPIASPEKAKYSVVVIQTILDGQENQTSHAKLLRKLKTIYPTIPHESFMKSFIQSLKGAMRHEEANETANLRLNLCANFIADPDYCTQEETHPIIVSTFDWLLGTISPVSVIRFRICQFVNLVLNAMGPEASLDDDICDKILKYMLERMRDVAPNVRVQATLALQRLQNPDDPEDDVFRVYTFHLENDPSPKVRQTIITSLGRNYRTIPYIIDRLWDVEERVRRHTYLQMSSYPVRQYKVAQRLTFLEQGLNEHSEAVRKVVRNVMIPQWFETYQKNYVQFVKALKIDADEKELERFGKTAKLALGEIFTKYGIDDAMAMLGLREEDKTVPVENLTIETAICWQALLEFLQNTESDELETLMVDLSAFCNYIKNFADQPTLCNYIREMANDQSMTTDKLQKMYFQSMMQVLLEIVDTYDLGDEVGRDNLKQVLAEVLCCSDLSEQNVKIILSIFERLIGDVETRFKFFVDLINSILEPTRADVSNSSRSMVDEYLEKNPDKSLQMKISSLRLKIMDLKEQEMEKVAQKDYAGAQRVSEELNAANEEYAAMLKPILLEVSTTSDASSMFRESMLKPKKITNDTINKCLQISFYLVNSVSVRLLTPIVCELYKSFISRYVETKEILTRDWALRCSIAFSMLYDGLAKETFNLLYQQFFKNHCTKIWQTSIEGIFELLDRYGFEHFDVESKKDESRKNSRQLYNTKDYLDQEDQDTSNTGSGVDLMRMMTHFFETCEDSVICSAIVDGFCRMILRAHYTSPDIMSKLLLKFFNPTTEPKIQQSLGIFFESLIQKKRQDILQKSLLNTLFTILEAPNENPLHEVKPEHVLKFVIDSTKPVFCSTGMNPHNSIAISFLEVMLDNLSYKDLLKLLSKELLTLEISDDQTLKEELTASTDRVLEEKTLDTKIIKNLNDFKQVLQGTYREPLSFSSSRAPPSAAVEPDTAANSDAEEAPEVAEEEETPATTSAPVLNKNALQKQDGTPPSPSKSSPAKKTTSPKTPPGTTFGTTNASGLKSLRKSMNFAPRTSDEVFKVPDANATKKLRQQQQKKAAEKQQESSKESESSPEVVTEPEDSFAIPSTQDVTESEGDQSILHLEIPETQEQQQEVQEKEPEASTPIQRTPTKRKNNRKKADSGSSDDSSTSSPRSKSSRKGEKALLEEEVGPSPNATISRLERSVAKPLVKASAKAIVESKGGTPAGSKTLPRTRGVVRTEVINSKVMTRRSLTSVTSKGRTNEAANNLTGIEPLPGSPTTRKKTVAEVEPLPGSPSTRKKTATAAQQKKEPSKLVSTTSGAKKSTEEPKTKEKPKPTEKKDPTPAVTKRVTTRKAQSQDESLTAKKYAEAVKPKETRTKPAEKKEPASIRPATRKSLEKPKTIPPKKPAAPAKPATDSPSTTKKSQTSSPATTTTTRTTRRSTLPAASSDSPKTASSGSATSVSSSSSSGSTSIPAKRTAVSTRASKGDTSMAKSTSSGSSSSAASSSVASPARAKRTAVTPLSAISATRRSGATAQSSPTTLTRPVRKLAKK